jgi:hypothetical protein
VTLAEQMFLEIYFGMLKAFTTDHQRHSWEVALKCRKQIGLRDLNPAYDMVTDVWLALLPIPELQLYVNDPLSPSESYQPDKNFRVDYGFWDGEKLTAVEIDGAEPSGYARDVRRDRLLRRDGVEMLHILNGEIMEHKARALLEYVPRHFFGFDWSYPSKAPDWEMPF